MKNNVAFTSMLVLLIAAVHILCPLQSARAREKKIKWVKSPTGIKSLMTLSKDMGKMNRQIKKETRNFEDVKEAMREGKLQPGKTCEEVQRSLGDPAISVADGEGSLTRWVYKPASSSYFQGEKASLFFGPENKLIKWELVEQKGKDRNILIRGPEGSSF